MAMVTNPANINSANQIANNIITGPKLVNGTITANKLDYPTTIKGLELISSQAPSAATSVDFTGLSNSTYAYFVLVWNLTGTNANGFGIQLNTVSTANYDYIRMTNQTPANNVNQTSFAGFASASGQVCTGSYQINSQGSGVGNIFNGSSAGFDGTNFLTVLTGQLQAAAGVNITQISLVRSGTNTMTGNVTLYGMRN